MTKAFALLVMGLAGCTSRGTAARDTPPTAASSSAIVDLGARPDAGRVSVPAALEIVAHLPGADPNRYLTVTLAIGLGTESTLVGCVSGAPGACDKTRRVVLDAADHQHFETAWQEVAGMPRCEPNARLPDDRLFSLGVGGVRYEDPLPADPAKLAERTRGPCTAPARLVIWVARRFDALP